MTKPRLTLEEHLELGSVLTGIRNELLHRGVDLANAYPRSGPEGAPYRALKQAMDRIEAARNTLDNLVHSEYPEEAQPAIYYAGEQAATIAIPHSRKSR
ncbi:hypothetical protein [Kitasatospora cheerisanensis]|uniref:Uncharacterized protein n=1 Tax=Kitasatospora cheerisanensis KCTC 2395 TaxID=1348663 RepID=A0A066YKR8_9ACTN|nr:hypothetical protein [Kitasatospora cheerisanensis]KDN80529.1 hypothetical protein KCH_76760 [Kitasatospora cheerisanensis KCTC 2395]